MILALYYVKSTVSLSEESNLCWCLPVIEQIWRLHNSIGYPCSACALLQAADAMLIDAATHAVSFEEPLASLRTCMTPTG
jgi:hypothetical protein